MIGEACPAFPPVPLAQAHTQTATPRAIIRLGLIAYAFTQCVRP